MYLTTSGSSHDPHFMQDLALLQDTIQTISEKHPDCVTYVRGDANAAVIPRPDNVRDELFKYFVTENSLVSTDINHKTYHHFVNEGRSDSTIDALLSSEYTSSGSLNTSIETLLKILCSKTNHLVDSSHDALISSLQLPPKPVETPTLGNIMAPKIVHSKHKIVWTDEGIHEYQNLLSQVLPDVSADYEEATEAGSASVFFQITNHILSSAAQLTNKVIELGKPPREKKVVVPSEIRRAMKQKEITLDLLKTLESSNDASTAEFETAQTNFKEAKATLQNLVRKDKVSKEVDRDSFLNQILTNQPKEVFKAVKANKSKNSDIKKLIVGDKVYTDDSVADGFFDNISELKTLHKITATSYESFADDHRHIIEISQSGKQIPRISIHEATNLLSKMKPNVTDFYSISAAHFLNAGDLGIKHFQFMFNKLLANIELASLEELNNVHAVILYKGHGKDKHLASSYRTISSCPFLSKAADVYLGSLSKDDWKSCQAETQFQGDGMCHELASLLLTTTIL